MAKNAHYPNHDHNHNHHMHATYKNKPKNALISKHALKARSVMATMLLILVLVLKLTSRKRSHHSPNNSMSTHLIPAKISCSATSQRTHQSSIALLLHIRICRAVSWCAGLASVWLLALGILLLRVCALLGELVRRGLARVL
jgi:hypothetical protein